MRPRAYDKFVLILTLPGLFVSIWFGLMILLRICFHHVVLPHWREIFTAVIAPVTIVSFVASPLAMLLYGRSSVKRFMSACFLFNGLYLLLWVVIALTLYISWSARANL